MALARKMLQQICFINLLAALIYAATDLETACTGSDRVYSGGSCLVLNKTAVHYSKAKVSCEHYLGYSGHLVFIRNVTVQNTLKQLIASNGVSSIYVGYEQTNTSGLRNASWVYAYTNGSSTSALYTPWMTGYPSGSSSTDRTVFTANGIANVNGESLTYPFVCEYEENLKHTVSDLETKCAALSWVHVYDNGHCYVRHDTTLNYFAAKLSCRDIPGINGHLIHIRNAEQVQIAETMMKADPTGAPVAWIGLEQPNMSAPDTTLPGSWFYSTPQEIEDMATFLPWVPGQPNDGTFCQFGCYCQTLHGLWDELGTTPYGFICEYESSRQMTTDLEPLCDAAGVNASLFNVATPDGHCYIMHTTAAVADAAKLSCNDIPGYKGHLVHIRNTSQQRIVENLMNVNMYSYSWIGMEHINQSSNRSSGWYYTTPADNNELATFLPWNPSYPTSNINSNNGVYYAGNSASNGLTGAINDFPNTNNFPFTCEYESTKMMVTDLEFKCASKASTNYQAYRNGSCFVMSNVGYYFNKASLSCKDFLGYDGHLIHLRSADDLIIANNLIIAGLNGNNRIWVGIEQTNLTGLDSKTDGWYYTTPSSNSEEATFLPWYTNKPAGGTAANNVYYSSSSSMIFDVPNTYAMFRFICQYEEKSKRDVTPTEIYCQNTTGWYFNGSCFADAASGQGNKTNVCPSAPQLAVHPAHLSSQEKILIAQRIGRRYSETIDTLYSNVQLYTGLQQLKACAGNSCAEENGKSWFYITPEGYKFPANVYNASFWKPNALNDTAGTLNIGVFTDTGFDSSNGLTTLPFVCEYHEPWNFTNFQKMCLKSPNPSTPVDNTCFTLSRKSYNFTDAVTQCNEFAGGHLAQVISTDMAANLRSNLWANFGIPNNMTLYTGLRQFPLTAADEPDKDYYYVMPDGTEIPAVNPPWKTGEPNASGDCGSLNQAGQLFAVDQTKMQWSICQYDCNVNSAWTAWSPCSQSCDKGIRSRQGKTYNISGNCNSSTTPTTVYEYESCTTGVLCKSMSTKITSLKSECLSNSGGYFAYSTCYFVANISGTQTDANSYCQSQGGQLASLFGNDLISQLGSFFLQSTSIQAWIGLQYTGGNLKWLVDSVPYTLFKNVTTPSAGSNCFALVSDRASPNAVENPRLTPMACTDVLMQAICMKSDKIHSSYTIKQGKKVIEAQSPESVSIEIDFNGCGARCSEIIGCVGFNFNPSDRSCIPTKVCTQMPSIINGAATYTVQDDSSWIFYERI